MRKNKRKIVRWMDDSSSSTMSSYTYLVASWAEKVLTSIGSTQISVDDQMQGDSSHSKQALLSSPAGLRSPGDKSAVSDIQREVERERERDREHAVNSGTVMGQIQSYFCCCKVLLKPITFCADMVLVPGYCIADKYSPIFNYLAYSPTYGMLIMLILYVLLIVIFTPFWVLGLLFGSTLSIITVLGCILIVCRKFARFMAFPGASSSLHKEISSDYLKRLSVQLNTFAAISAQFAVLVASSDITRTKLGARFQISGANSNPSAGGATVVSKAQDFTKWITALQKLHAYLGSGVEQFQRVHNSASGYLTHNFATKESKSSASTDNGAYTPLRGNCRSWLTVDRLVPLVLRIFKGNTENTNVKFRSQGKQDIDAAVDPIVALHHVLGSLLTNSITLVNFVSDNVDAYSPGTNTTIRRPKATTSSLSINDNSAPVTDPNSVSNSIGLIVRNGEALRAALQYMLECSVETTDAGTNGILSKLTNGIPAAQGLINVVLHSQDGAKGPAQISSFIMREQLVGTHNARQFTVMGDDGNFIDCILFPGNKYGEKQRRKKKHKKHKKLNRKSSVSRSVAVDSDNSDSDDTAASATTTGTNTTMNSHHTSMNANIDQQSEKNPLNTTNNAIFYGQSDTELFSSSKYGTCLFCAPNAGFYESWVLIPENVSWLSYYTHHLGMDLVMFNYRGYNESTGVPTPDRIKADGLAVYDFVRRVLCVQHLVLHGESIGGMVANHIASWEESECHSQQNPMNLVKGSTSNTDGDVEMNSSKANSNTQYSSSTTGAYAVPDGTPIIKALICDRTFASLDSVAARLLGTWAAHGLWYLGCWRTNNIEDYLSVSCTKIVLQDTSDQIVHNFASLQAGVACSEVEAPHQDTLSLHFWPKNMDKNLRLACFQKNIPPLTEDLQVLEASIVLENADITSHKTDLDKISTASSVGMMNIASGITACIFHVAHLAEEASSDLSNRLNHDSSLGTIPITTFEPNLEWICDYCIQPLGIASDVDRPPAEDDAEDACAKYQHSNMEYLSLYEKIWSVLLRTNNGAGHTIGELIINHAENERSNKHIFGDGDYIKNLICEAVYTWCCTAVTYKEVAMKGDEGSCDSYSFSRNIGQSIHDLDMIYAQHNVNKHTLSYNEDNTVLLYIHHALCYVYALGNEYRRKYTASQDRHNPAGYLIPVSCGHSGWPDGRALAALTACLSHAGFPTPQPESPQHRFNALFP
jgi:hypothetical protein